MIDYRMPTVAMIALLALSACSKTDQQLIADILDPGKDPNVPAGTLPVSASGKMAVVRLPATVESEVSSWDGLPIQRAHLTSATATDRTSAGGVGISGSAEADPNPNDKQGGGPALPALISASADGTLAGGAPIIGLDKAKGVVYFENGNFGDPQVSSANAAISAVGVYNLFDDSGLTGQVILENSTTIRYRDGNQGDTEANFGVGYVGNPTATMPGSGTATYKGFYEQGVGAFQAAGGPVRQLYLKGDGELMADFGAGTVSGGVTNGELMTTNPDGSNPVNVNPAVAGMALDATISGTEYSGTARLVDSAGAQVGTVSDSQVVGGFFGADARETIAASQIEGRAMLDGAESDYVIQGVIGAVKQ